MMKFARVCAMAGLFVGAQGLADEMEGLIAGHMPGHPAAAASYW